MCVFIGFESVMCIPRVSGFAHHKLEMMMVVTMGERWRGVHRVHDHCSSMYGVGEYKSYGLLG